jgi:hypothetical protein
MSLQRPLTTCFVCLCGAGMCEECDAIGMVLPSLESLRQQWNLPKIYFLFYDYFLKSVIQESVWIDRVNTPSSGTGSRLGPVISKAYALALLENHYFSWLYQYKIEHPNNTLVTEYDQRDNQGGDNANKQQEKEIDLFCGALVLSDCEILVPVNTTAINTANEENEQQEAGRNNNFKILVLSDKTADPAAHKAARDHAHEISKGIKIKIDCDRQGNGDDGYYTRHDSYKKMSSMLDQDMLQINQENSTNVKKRKRKSKSGMTAFTSSVCKSKKGSDEIAGWSTEGKKFMCQIFNEIKHNEQSGVRKKWEDTYKHMCKATKQDKAKTVDDDDEIEAPFEMDANMLYMEV